MNRRLYALHRWLSAIALVQLAIWVGTGLFFAAVPLAQVKGTPAKGANSFPITVDETLVPIESVVRQLQSQGNVERVELVGTSRGPMYRCKVGGRRLRIDARSGREAPVDSAEAEEIARNDQPGRPAVSAVTRVEKDPDIEYRSLPLPAWRVELADDARTVVYVDASTSEVTARRNDLWRVYDFLWSLHIMDYRERDSFNHPLLVGAAALGCLTVVSGAVLWGVRIVRRARRSNDPRGNRASQRRKEAERTTVR